MTVAMQPASDWGLTDYLDIQIDLLPGEWEYLKRLAAEKDYVNLIQTFGEIVVRDLINGGDKTKVILVGNHEAPRS